MKGEAVRGWIILWWNGSNGYIGSTDEEQRIYKTEREARYSMEETERLLPRTSLAGRVVAEVTVIVPRGGGKYERFLSVSVPRIKTATKEKI